MAKLTNKIKAEIGKLVADNPAITLDDVAAAYPTIDRDELATFADSITPTATHTDNEDTDTVTTTIDQTEDDNQDDTEGTEDDNQDDNEGTEDDNQDDNETDEEPLSDNPAIAGLQMQIKSLEASMGDKAKDYETAQQALNEINAQRDAQIAIINELKPLVGDAQMQINRLRKAIDLLSGPLTLTTRGSVTTRKTGDASQEQVNRVLNLVRKLPPVFDKSQWALTKGCPESTAGGDLKRYTDAGILTQPEGKGSGKYTIADKYKSQV